MWVLVLLVVGITFCAEIVIGVALRAVGSSRLSGEFGGNSVADPTAADARAG